MTTSNDPRYGACWKSIIERGARKAHQSLTWDSSIPDMPPSQLYVILPHLPMVFWSQDLGLPGVASMYTVYGKITKGETPSVQLWESHPPGWAVALQWWNCSRVPQAAGRTPSPMLCKPQEHIGSLNWTSMRPLLWPVVSALCKTDRWLFMSCQEEYNTTTLHVRTLFLRWNNFSSHGCISLIPASLGEGLGILFSACQASARALVQSSANKKKKISNEIRQ